MSLYNMATDIEEIYNSVFKIVTSSKKPNYEIPYLNKPIGQGIGAGFFFSTGGLGATAAHVIENSVDLWIQIPTEGKKYFNAEIVCVFPDFDIAIIRVHFKNKKFLKLGDSDTLSLRDLVYTIGYPNNPEYPKVTTGTISGNIQDYVQTDTAVNPGNSGGPLLNNDHEVVGITSAVIRSSDGQRSDGNSLITPINYFKNNLDEMMNNTSRILHKNVLGIVMKHNSDNYRIFNNIPKSCKNGIVIHYILKGSPLSGIVDRGDILCQISHSNTDYKIDDFGEIEVDWSNVKISVNNLIKRSSLRDEVEISFFSLKKRKMKKKTITLKPYDEVYPIKKLFLPVDKLDYEVFGGMIFMDLTLNHLSSYQFRDLTSLFSGYNIFKPQLVVSYIFQNSKVSQYNSFSPYTVITNVNNLETNTLEKFRENVKKTITKNKKEFILIENHNNESVLLNLNEIIKDDKKLIKDYAYDNTSINQYFNNLFN